MMLCGSAGKQRKSIIFGSKPDRWSMKTLFTMKTFIISRNKILLGKLPLFFLLVLVAGCKDQFPEKISPINRFS